MLTVSHRLWSDFSLPQFCLKKKTLDFPQNLENKGPEFFLPCRSMVLKVVRGKIFQTLELCDLFWRPSFSFECAGLQLSKSEDYLLDNLCIVILSQIGG